MRNHKLNHTKVNLLLDIALTGAFLVVLKPFLTGMALHEWLGLAIGGALAVHMLLHWSWIVAVTRKLAGKAPQQARLYYALDAVLLAGFLAIIGSGVAMSQEALPLFDFRGPAYTALATLHKYVSYGMLALLVVKLGLHWKWIVNAVRCHILGMKKTPARKKTAQSAACPAAAQASAQPMLSRRRFLILGGSAVCVAYLVGKWNPRRGLDGETARADTLTQTNAVAPQDTQTATAPPTPTATAAPTQAVVAPPTPSTEAPPTPQPTAAPTATPRIVTRCPYGMVNDPYPGRCRRYTDQNGNGICDYSEPA